MKLYNVMIMFETFNSDTATNISATFFDKNKAIQAGKNLAAFRKVPFNEEGVQWTDNQVYIKEFETVDEPIIKGAIR